MGSYRPPESPDIVVEDAAIPSTETDPLPPWGQVSRKPLPHLSWAGGRGD